MCLPATAVPWCLCVHRQRNSFIIFCGLVNILMQSLSRINISMIKSSSLNGCRDYVGNWSHLEAAEKVCTEDSPQPWSGEKRSGASSSRRGPLPSRLLCKHARYLCNKYWFIFVISLMCMCMNFSALPWYQGQLLFHERVCRVLQCPCGMDWKC